MQTATYPANSKPQFHPTNEMTKIKPEYDINQNRRIEEQLQHILRAVTTLRTRNSKVIARMVLQQ
jgi:hypothetical protein